MSAPLMNGRPVACTYVRQPDGRYLFVPHDHDPKRDAELAKMHGRLGAASASLLEFSGGKHEPLLKPFDNHEALNREVEEHRAIAAQRVKAMGYKP